MKFNRKTIYLMMLVASVLAWILAGMLLISNRKDSRIVFLDVGQGDAVLIQKGATQILIDGGPSEQVLLEKLGQHMPFWDRNIEIIIATHPDQDHIQGLIGVFKSYKIGALFESGTKNDSQLYKKYEDLIIKKGIRKIEPGQKTSIEIGGIGMEIFHPGKDGESERAKDTNSSSLVEKFSFGETTFLLMGDLPSEEENEMISMFQTDWRADVLKVAHHGSKYSTSDEFLDKISPQTAILSVGKNNRFGHPSLEVLERLNQRGIETLRTDKEGDIEFSCLDRKNDCRLKNKK